MFNIAFYKTIDHDINYIYSIKNMKINNLILKSNKFYYNTKMKQILII